jgi:heat shock protein HslJ
MKNFFLTLAFISTLACNKTDEVKESIIGQWQIDGFVANENAIAKNTGSNLYLNFHHNKSMTTSWEVNGCQSNYQINESTLSMGELTCTKACCDSEFATELTGLIPLVDSYEISNGKLNLTGEQGLKIRLFK